MLVAMPSAAQQERKNIREGNRLYRQKQYQQAEILYRKALANNKSNPQAAYNLACALMMQQKDSAAIVQYESAAKMEDNKLRRSKSFHNIGVILQAHRMYGDAIKAYEESLRNNPKDDETRYNLALCKKMNKQKPQQPKEQKEEKKNEKQDNKDKQDEKKQQEQNSQQMSKDNAEQLLNAAIQKEKDTQQRLKKAMQQPRRKNFEKNW
jgi:Ca-activated chloride channel family protein